MRERLPATISAPRRPHPPANATIALLGTLFGIAVLANVFAAYFVTQEHYVYFWDYSGYRLLSVDVNALLFHDPADAIRRVIGSIRWSDYNALPVLPLLPFFWLFGESRLTYILAITNAALLPGAVALGIFAHRFLRSRLADRSLTPLLLAITSVLTLHSMWTPVLRGYPDALGVVVIGGILLIHFAKPLAEQRPSYLIGTGLLLCLLVLIRRWYAFWVVAFIPALAAAQALAIYQGRRYLASQYIAAARNAAVIGLTFAAALFILATPFALRALGTDYSDIYSAYRFSNSVWAATQLIPPQFGWIGIFCAASGLALLTLRRETRVVGIFLIVQSGTVFWLFTRTQDFSVQHYYLSNADHCCGSCGDGYVALGRNCESGMENNGGRACTYLSARKFRCCLLSPRGGCCGKG